MSYSLIDSLCYIYHYDCHIHYLYLILCYFSISTAAMLLGLIMCGRLKPQCWQSTSSSMPYNNLLVFDTWAIWTFIENKNLVGFHTCNNDLMTLKVALFLFVHKTGWGAGVNIIIQCDSFQRNIGTVFPEVVVQWN